MKCGGVFDTPIRSAIGDDWSKVVWDSEETRFSLQRASEEIAKASLFAYRKISDNVVARRGTMRTGFASYGETYSRVKNE